MSKDTYYFQHDYDSTADPKIQAMLSVDGALGFALYWRIIEMMHSDANHKLPSKPYIFMALAQQMKADVAQVAAFITQAIEVYELFKTDGVFFWSERVLRNIEKRNILLEKKSAAGKISGLTRAKKLTGVEQVLTCVEHNSTKERKGKEIKLEEIILESSIAIEEHSQLALSEAATIDSHFENLSQRGKKLYEMFRRLLDIIKYDDQFVIIEVNKFENKYPGVLANKAGPLVNKWSDNIINKKDIIKEDGVYC